MKKILTYLIVVMASGFASYNNNKTGDQKSASDANKNSDATTSNNTERKAADNLNGNSSVKLELVFADRPDLKMTTVVKMHA